METQVIIKYGCEDGCFTVYGAKSEEDWLFWPEFTSSALDDNDEVIRSQSDCTGPKTSNLLEALDKKWIYFSPDFIHPDFVPWFRAAFERQWAQLDKERDSSHERRHRFWQERHRLWQDFLWRPSDPLHK